MTAFKTQAYFGWAYFLFKEIKYVANIEKSRDFSQHIDV